MADPFGPLHIYLQSIGVMKDAEIPLVSAALALGALDRPGLQLERYHHYLEKLGPRVRARHAELLAAGADDDVHTQLAALKHILVDAEGYSGDKETYDHLDNTSLIRTIDRRKGLPITIAILYIHAGLTAGFAMAGLSFPGHFLVRIEYQAQRLIVDVFDQCTVLEAAQMRALLKKALGPEAELSVDYYQSATNRDILIRLQNNIKLRLIGAEDYEGALRTVEAMRLIDPEEFRLLLDAGVLYSKLGQPTSAITALEDYIAMLPFGHRNRRDAQLMLDELRAQIN